ncbi:hypothetical protein GQ44DRAFT_709359 [Phaeosphaeriaceae sp. PMI808]|nr:hypothetical protein GQ44DRAFT_709359 [Phaeosphaeriaceae sp. PMI808]
MGNEITQVATTTTSTDKLRKPITTTTTGDWKNPTTSYEIPPIDNSAGNLPPSEICQASEINRAAEFSISTQMQWGSTEDVNAMICNFTLGQNILVAMMSSLVWKRAADAVLTLLHMCMYKVQLNPLAWLMRMHWGRDEGATLTSGLGFAMNSQGRYCGTITDRVLSLLLLDEAQSAFWKVRSKEGTSCLYKMTIIPTYADFCVDIEVDERLGNALPLYVCTVS